MRIFIFTILIIIRTHYGASASSEKHGRNLATNDVRSSKLYEQEPIHLSSRLEDEIRNDSHSRNKRRVRFEDNPHKSPDKPNFFPTDESTNSDSNEDTNNDIAETPLYNDQVSDNNLDYNQDEEKIFTKYENTYDKDVDNERETPATDNGRVIFEDDNNKENREPFKKQKRKSRKRPDNNILESPNAPYSGYSGPGFHNHHSIQSHIKRPGNNQYQTAGSYGLYSGHQLQKPLRKIKNPLQTNSGEDSDVQRPYRRPDDHRQEYAGAAYSGYLPQAGFAGGYGYVTGPNSQNGLYGQYPGHNIYPVHPRRPKSLTQQAVSAAAEALTSIALFDDKQCVPRLLCEAASGRTAGSPMLLKATAGIGPLLSILQSYTASSSPLFVFGRAAVLGVTSVGNTIACHRAYPNCPKDPTELINYLNNHNGGFFRFFGQPKGPQKQQNLEQFYNHLSGQTQQLNQQQYQPNYANTYGYGNQLYPKNNEANYSDEDETNSKVLDVETSPSEIQERIQNKPGIDVINAETSEEEEEQEGSKWTFPHEADSKRKYRKPRRPMKQKITNPNSTRGDRIGSVLKFPDDRRSIEDRPNTDRERDFVRTQKLIFFQNNNNLDYDNYQTNTIANSDDYVFDYKHNFYVKRPKQIYNAVSHDEAQLVYIVRGNGDPNYPEIVRVKPGQRL